MKRLTLAGLLVATAALADTTSTRPLVHAREAALQRDKLSADDIAGYLRCGQDKIDVYNKDPEAKTNDLVLFDAATCFLKARAVGSAIIPLNLLRKYYPQSPAAKTAGGTLGMLYGSVAFFDRAADNLEDYAKQYPKEPDALDALSDAAFFRAAVNDPAKARADAEIVTRTYAVARPADAARAVFDTLASATDDKPLRAYLTDYGDKGGGDKLAIVHARLARAIAARACTTSLTDGLCATATRTTETCGGGSTLTAARRSPNVLREARDELVYAQKAYEAAKRPIEARHELALAELALADVELEVALGDPKQAQAAVAAYDAIIARQDADTSLRAQRREALLLESHSTCSSRDKAVAAMRACVTAGEKSGVAGDELRACRFEAAWLDHANRFAPILPAPARIKLPVRYEGPTIGDAKDKDLSDALAQLKKDDATDGAWTKSECNAMVKRLASTKAAAGHYLAGLALHRCGRDNEARAQWEKALDVDARHAESISNLGALAMERGDRSLAKKQWDTAIKTNGKLLGARLGIAALEFDELRAQPNATSPDAKRLDEDLRFNLSNALAVGGDDAEVLGIYAVVLADGLAAHPERLGVTTWMIARAKSRGESSVTWLAEGIVAVRAGEWAAAVHAFRTAGSPEARFDAAIVELWLGRYADALKDLQSVTDKGYDLTVATAAALQGLGKTSDATSLLEDAKRAEPGRPEAWFALAANALASSDKDAIRKARDAFSEAAQRGAREAVPIVTLLDRQLATP